MRQQIRTAREAYRPAWEKARHDLQNLDPKVVGWRSDARYEETEEGRGRFQLPFLGRNYVVRYPDVTVWDEETGQEPPMAVQIILLHYLIHADGTPPAGQWLAFRQFPGGLGYEAAHKQRASIPLTRAFGQDCEAFVQAARALGGESLDFGDASFLFRALPRLWLAVVLHLGDEEFPPSARVLYDAAAGHYLPTEDLAVLANLLSGYLIKAAGKEERGSEG
ncbi:MAG: DUF3786 domain-containing protein [Anaerolineae bacterium]